MLVIETNSKNKIYRQRQVIKRYERSEPWWPSGLECHNQTCYTHARGLGFEPRRCWYFLVNLKYIGNGRVRTRLLSKLRLRFLLRMLQFCSSTFDQSGHPRRANDDMFRKTCSVICISINMCRPKKKGDDAWLWRAGVPIQTSNGTTESNCRRKWPVWFQCPNL